MRSFWIHITWVILSATAFRELRCTDLGERTDYLELGLETERTQCQDSGVELVLQET